jgi:hypothetical protein
LFSQLGLGTVYSQFDAGCEMTAMAIGTNSTGFPNLRHTFNLKKQAPK